MRYFHALFLILPFSMMACKKGSNAPVNNNAGGNTAQINYTSQLLVLSAAEKVESPWIEVYPDSVYSTMNIGSNMIKAIPKNFEDKVISFYLPKGYMAVFAENPDGTGASASFVAVENSIKANLPSRLRNNISYIRYMKINNPEKKGTCSTSDPSVQAFGAQWHYTWGINRTSFPNQQFVPMTWGKGTCNDENVKLLLERNDIDHLLSFNEPDNSSQSNVPVDTAIQRYKLMQKTGLRLGSPVVTQDEAIVDGKWLPNFMVKAKAQQLRIDYVAVHWYDWGNQNNNAGTDSLTAERVFSRFVAYIGRVRQAYPGYPIWVTEYNANINRSSQVIHKYFMKLSSEWMNNSAFIERYSYFFPNSVPGVTGNTNLTDAGLYWKSLGSTKVFSGNIIQDAIPVN